MPAFSRTKQYKRGRQILLPRCLLPLTAARLRRYYLNQEITAAANATPCSPTGPLVRAARRICTAKASIRSELESIDCETIRYFDRASAYSQLHRNIVV